VPGDAARAFLAWMLALMAMRNYASLPFSNSANRLACQTACDGNFDPQRFSGALANPIRHLLQAVSADRPIVVGTTSEPSLTFLDPSPSDDLLHSYSRDGSDICSR